MEGDVHEFADWFCQHYGQDFRLYRHATLASRLRHICTRLNLDGPHALRDWISRHPDQVDGVVDQLCVPVSDLFREPEILCRNVLIYFQPELQARALDIFADSLARGGRLCLGQREQPLAGTNHFARKPGSRWIYRPMRPAGQPLRTGGLVPPSDERMT